jgi:hypothetical protein
VGHVFDDYLKTAIYTYNTVPKSVNTHSITIVHNALQNNVNTTAVKCDDFSYRTVWRASRIGRLLPPTDQAPVPTAADSSLSEKAAAPCSSELSVMKVYVGMEATFKHF